MLRAEVEDIMREAGHRQEVQDESRKRRKEEDRKWARPVRLLTGLSYVRSIRGSAIHVLL